MFDERLDKGKSMVPNSLNDATAMVKYAVLGDSIKKAVLNAVVLAIFDITVVIVGGNQQTAVTQAIRGSSIKEGDKFAETTMRNFATVTFERFATVMSKRFATMTMKRFTAMIKPHSTTRMTRLLPMP